MVTTPFEELKDNSIAPSPFDQDATRDYGHMLKYF